MIEHEPTPGPHMEQPAPRLFDVTIKHPLTLPFVTFAMIPVAVAFALSIPFYVRVSSSNWGRVLGMLPFAVLLVLWLFLSRALARRAVARQLRDGWMEDLPGTTNAILRATRFLQPMSGIHDFIRQAGRAGLASTVLRLCQEKHIATLEPIGVPFEPQRLDETDTTLLHIAGDADAIADEAVDPVWRSIKRNVRVKGGWLFVIIFSISVLFQGLMSWRSGRATWDFVWYTALLLSILFIPVGGFASSKQLLAVPGGLLYRKASRNAEQWETHLFARESSVVCVYQAGKRQWQIIVADNEKQARWAGTKTEMEFAVRAWLSPLEPPPIERLREFT